MPVNHSQTQAFLGTLLSGKPGMQGIPPEVPGSVREIAAGVVIPEKPYDRYGCSYRMRMMSRGPVYTMECMVDTLCCMERRQSMHQLGHMYRMKRQLSAHQRSWMEMDPRTHHLGHVEMGSRTHHLGHVEMGSRTHQRGAVEMGLRTHQRGWMRRMGMG